MFRIPDTVVEMQVGIQVGILSLNADRLSLQLISRKVRWRVPMSKYSPVLPTWKLIKSYIPNLSLRIVHRFELHAPAWIVPRASTNLSGTLLNCNGTRSPTTDFASLTEPREIISRIVARCD